MGDFAFNRGRRRAYHEYADDISELRESNLGDRFAKPGEYYTDDPGWWHEYYKADSDKYGGPRPRKRTIEQAI